MLEQYTLIPLRDLVVFPYMIVPIFVGRKRSVNALNIANETDKRIFLTLQKDPQTDEPTRDDVHEVGVVADILQVLKLPDGTVKLLVEGVKRARIVGLRDENDCYFVDVEPVEVIPGETDPTALKKTLVSGFAEYAKGTKKVAEDIITSVSQIDDVEQLSFMIAANLHIRPPELQGMLELDPVDIRAERISEAMRTEIEILKIDDKIKQRVKTQMSKAQREYYLNEQMKAIQKELGKDEEGRAEMEELEAKFTESEMIPDHVKERAMRELKKLKQMPPMSAETTVVRNYLDWLTNVPWGVSTDDSIEMDVAEEILDRDHFSLEKSKERILEFLAVRKLSDNLKGPIICLVGPPGVGKTSLARSIAESMGRKFVRMSLGGVRDEAEIRGHRRTYIGALPGKIVQSLRKAGSMNPVFLLDEIDKLGSDFRGDPSSALLETLDPEQNKSFMDHYIELEMDLSRVFFITTANTVDSIPAPLRDRMEMIRVPGYTEQEKFQIAKRFLLPKQLEEHSLDKERVRITDSALIDVIQHYTKEAGVRNLERQIASLIRKAARKLVTNDRTKQIRINERNIDKYLGIRPFKHDLVFDTDEVGMATGLAWTPYGGDILVTEIAAFEGSGRLVVTGHLGEVMQESAKTALTVVKSRAAEYDIPSYKFKDFDIHLHVPEGAVPKDGPSAGITIATAMLSALSNQKVNCRIAMTGEITLRGKVLAVGGIKEKVLAAHRAGVTTIVLPADNEKDLTEIPADVKNEIRFHFASTIDDVLGVVLAKPKSAAAK